MLLKYFEFSRWWRLSFSVRLCFCIWKREGRLGSFLSLSSCFFRATGSSHVGIPCTSGNRTLAETGVHMFYLIYCPFCGIKIRGILGLLQSGINSITDGNWTSILVIVYSYTCTLCIRMYAYFKKLWKFISWFNENSCYSYPYHWKPFYCETFHVCLFFKVQQYLLKLLYNFHDLLNVLEKVTPAPDCAAAIPKAATKICTGLRSCIFARLFVFVHKYIYLYGVIFTSLCEDIEAIMPTSI